MEIRSIMCCCGSGLGSSMLVRMNVDTVLKELGVKGIDVSHSSLSDVSENAADLFVVGKDLEEFVKHMPRIVVLDNIIDMEELRSKLAPYFIKL